MIQLAKASGFSSIITTAAPKHAVHLRSLGATDIIDRNIPFTELKGEIEKLTNAPIKYVFDAISSKETQQAGHDLLPSGGHLIVVLDPTLNKAHDVDVTHVYGILALPQNRVLLEALYSKWTELLEDGVFVVSPLSKRARPVISDRRSSSRIDIRFFRGDCRVSSMVWSSCRVVKFRV